MSVAGGVPKNPLSKMALVLRRFEPFENFGNENIRFYTCGL